MTLFPANLAAWSKTHYSHQQRENAMASGPSSRLPELLPLMAAGMLACAVGTTEAAGAVTLQVTVTGVRNSDGTVNICVFDTEKDFPDCSGRPALVSRRQPARPGSVRFDFDVAPGPHAVSVLHDENGNGRLDTNLFGIPREGGGVSNNPLPRRGPPRFADAVFHVPPEGGQIVVRMVYP